MNTRHAIQHTAEEDRSPLPACVRDLWEVEVDAPGPEQTVLKHSEGGRQDTHSGPFLG